MYIQKFLGEFVLRTPSGDGMVWRVHYYELDYESYLTRYHYREQITNFWVDYGELTHTVSEDTMEYVDVNKLNQAHKTYFSSAENKLELGNL
jgi:hypothetical protein